MHNTQDGARSSISGAQKCDHQTNNNDKKTHAILDIIGIGVGPFNLSLAALATPNTELNSLFFEQKDNFEWHSGLLINNCTLQVPFMADLVTMADPTNPYTYLNYLHKHKKLYHFYFYEEFKIPRIDYNQYCQWVANDLTSVRFSSEVTQVEPVIYQGQQTYYVSVMCKKTQQLTHYYSHNIVLGTGTTPSYPAALSHCKYMPNVCHSAAYLHKKKDILKTKKITVVGAGQSAGEIVLDLLQNQTDTNYHINWLTRSDGFLPMEYSKLGLEHFSPEYIDHFFSLNETTRNHVKASQDLWYKGISADTIADIYNHLYQKSLTSDISYLTMQACSQLEHVTTNNNALSLHFTHRQLHTDFHVDTDYLILATGHAYTTPQCLNNMADIFKRDKHGRLHITRDYRLETDKSEKSASLSTHAHTHSIFVQNAEIHTHGIGAPDLGLGAYRSAHIINTITQKNYYAIHKKNVFQHFGIAPKWQSETNTKIETETETEIKTQTDCTTRP